MSKLLVFSKSHSHWAQVMVMKYKPYFSGMALRTLMLKDRELFHLFKGSVVYEIDRTAAGCRGGHPAETGNQKSARGIKKPSARLGLVFFNVVTRFAFLNPTLAYPNLLMLPKYFPPQKT